MDFDLLTLCINSKTIYIQQINCEITKLYYIIATKLNYKHYHSIHASCFDKNKTSCNVDICPLNITIVSEEDIP